MSLDHDSHDKLYPEFYQISSIKITNNTIKQDVPIKQDMFIMLDNISQLLSLIRFDRVISCGL